MRRHYDSPLVTRVLRLDDNLNRRADFPSRGPFVGHLTQAVGHIAEQNACGSGTPTVVRDPPGASHTDSASRCGSGQQSPERVMRRRHFEVCFQLGHILASCREIRLEPY